MVLFPEGGFLRKRLEVSQKYAAKNNLPLLSNVTLPRIGALKAITEIIPPHNSIGNNNAAAKRMENGTSGRPFGSQGMTFINNDFIFHTISISFHGNCNLTLLFRLFFSPFPFAEHIFQYQSKKDDDTDGPNLDYVLDVTVAYPDRIPLDLLDIVTGIRPACKTHFLYRLYHSSEVRSYHCYLNQIQSRFPFAS